MADTRHVDREQHRRALPQAVGIAMYHAIVRSPLPVPDWCFLDEGVFRGQMKYLKNTCEVIPLSTAVTRLKESSIHGPTVAITLDDGFQNNREVAFPILREAGLPATVFLATGVTGTDDTVWFCRLNRALAKTSHAMLEWGGRRFDLSRIAAKARASHLIQARLTALPPRQLSAELREIILELGDDPDSPIEADSPFRMLDREAIRDMTATGLIEVGAHTRSHAILSLLSPEERRDEIEQSLDTVEEITGRPCKLFAYPNGRSQDYDEDSISILKSRGVHTCVTAIEGLNDRMTPALELRRYGIGGDVNDNDFARLMHEVQGDA